MTEVSWLAVGFDCPINRTGESRQTFSDCSHVTVGGTASCSHPAVQAAAAGLTRHEATQSVSVGLACVLTTCKAAKDRWPRWGLKSKVKGAWLDTFDQTRAGDLQPLSYWLMRSFSAPSPVSVWLSLGSVFFNKKKNQNEQARTQNKQEPLHK